MNKRAFVLYLIMVVAGIFLLAIAKMAFNDMNYPPLKMPVRYIYLSVFSLLFGFFAILLNKAKKFEFLSIKNTLLIATALGVLLLCVGPLLSQDVKSYIMYTRVLNIHHANPYYVVADNFPDDPFKKGTFWTWNPSPYGPVWIILTSAFTFFAGNSFFLNNFLIRMVPLLGYLGLIWQIGKLDPSIGEERKRYLRFFFAFNPFILVDYVVDGHTDLICIFLLVFSLTTLFNRSNVALSAMLFTSGVLVKYIPLMVLPIILIYILLKESIVSGFRKVSTYIGCCLLTATVLFMPFFKGFDIFDMLLKQKFSMGIDSNTMPYLYIMLFQKLHIFNIQDAFHPPAYVTNILHLLFLASYIGIFIAYIRSKRLSKDLYMAILSIFVAYFAFAAFQFSAWFFIWILPFLFVSDIKEKEYIALGLSFIGLIDFYKRLSFLLAIAVAMYILYKLSKAVYLKYKSSRQVLT